MVCICFREVLKAFIVTWYFSLVLKCHSFSTLFLTHDDELASFFLFFFFFLLFFSRWGRVTAFEFARLLLFVMFHECWFHNLVHCTYNDKANPHIPPVKKDDVFTQKATLAFGPQDTDEWVLLQLDWTQSAGQFLDGLQWWSWWKRSQTFDCGLKESVPTTCNYSLPVQRNKKQVYLSIHKYKNDTGWTLIRDFFHTPR